MVLFSNLIFPESCLCSSILYINNLAWLFSLSYVVQFVLISTDFNKEANPRLHGKHQNFGMIKVLGYMTVYYCLSKIISSILAVFSSGYEHIEVLLNP